MIFEITNDYFHFTVTLKVNFITEQDAVNWNHSTFIIMKSVESFPLKNQPFNPPSCAESQRSKHRFEPQTLTINSTFATTTCSVKNRSNPDWLLCRGRIFWRKLFLLSKILFALNPQRSCHAEKRVVADPDVMFLSSDLKCATLQVRTSWRRGVVLQKDR